MMRAGKWWTELADLVLPRTCAGCGAAGASLCAQCQHAWSSPPSPVTPQVGELPVWACGPYAGVRRSTIIASKERGRRDVWPQLGAVIDAAVEFLVAAGELPGELTLIPAPTRLASIRERGGDPVSAACHHTRWACVDAVYHGRTVADSVGLDASARRRNLAGGVVVRQVPAGPLLLVDDIVTTGSTLAATSDVLRAAGGEVVGALVYAAA
ncbi:MAG: ComF family protein [Corynebacterium sp.]|nr:ComF family protein [Corynebacterium sp.]